MRLKIRNYFKECLCALFCFFLSGNYFSQTIAIKDSIDKKPIAFCEILINDKTYYSDSLGNFECKDIQHKLNIKKFGYKDKIIYKLSDTPYQIIYMSPKYISIPGIDLKPTEQLTIKPNVKKTNTTILSTGFDLGFKLVNNTGRNALIKQIILPIKEIRNSNYYLKLDFYELTDNKNDITSKKINGDSQFIPVASLQSGNNAISLDEKIALPKEGVLLSMRIIENIGKYSDRVTNPVIVFYHDKVFGNTYFYNSKHIWEEFKSNPKIAIGLVLLQ